MVTSCNSIVICRWPKGPKKEVQSKSFGSSYAYSAQQLCLAWVYVAVSTILDGIILIIKITFNLSCTLATVVLCLQYTVRSAWGIQRSA